MFDRFAIHAHLQRKQVAYAPVSHFSQMASYGVARDVVIKAIMEKQHGCVSTTYYLLMHKLKKEHGGHFRASGVPMVRKGNNNSSVTTTSKAATYSHSGSKVAGVSDLQATLARTSRQKRNPTT